MLMVVAKRLCRSPQSEEIPLLSLLIDPLVKTCHLLEWDPTPFLEMPPPHSPEEKTQLLYSFAEEMKEMMSIISERGQAVPALILPGAFRYLELVRSIL